MFCNEDCKHGLIEHMHFKKQAIKTTLKDMFITHGGDDLWNDLEESLKSSSTLKTFKKL